MAETTGAISVRIIEIFVDFNSTVLPAKRKHILQLGCYNGIKGLRIEESPTILIIWLGTDLGCIGQKQRADQTISSMAPSNLDTTMILEMQASDLNNESKYYIYLL